MCGKASAQYVKLSRSCATGVFMKRAGLAVLVLSAATLTCAQTTYDYDLLIKGGHVIDAPDPRWANFGRRR
jgi:hypothetical protein